MSNFYDTSSLLLCSEEIFATKEKIVFSSITLNELEHIKTASNKDENIKYSARQLLHYLNNNPHSYECQIYTDAMSSIITDKSLELTNDAKILASAVYYRNQVDPYLNFYTNDLALKHLAQIFFHKENIKSISEEPDDYTGYKDIVMGEDEMAYFYSNLDQNLYDLQINEYLNILDKDNKVIDSYCWSGDSFRKLKYYSFNSGFLGEVKPKKGDIYQAIAADSLVNNKITMLKGPAGSGKSYLSLGYLFYALEKGKIDKIILFCNPVATKGSARLGSK